jgi:hypothetical protein
LEVRFAELLFCTPPRYAPTLVFHDRRDVRVSVKDGIAIVQTWPAARFVQTRGLGRHKILRDAGVIEQAVYFLQVQNLGAPADRSGRRPACLLLRSE